MWGLGRVNCFALVPTGILMNLPTPWLEGEMTKKGLHELYFIVQLGSWEECRD